MRVAAFITNKNRPSVNKVIGRVKKTNIGLMKTLSMDNIKLAIKAVPKLSIWKLPKNCATIIKATAFKKIDRNQRKNINIPYIFTKISYNIFTCAYQKHMNNLHYKMT